VYHKRLTSATRCTLHLRGGSSQRGSLHLNGGSASPLYIKINGRRRDDVDTLTKIALKKIAESVAEEENMTLLVYQLAFENPSFSVLDRDAAFVHIPPDFRKKKWISVVRMPSDYVKYAGLFIGRNGAALRRMRKESQCWIEARNTKRPHLFISGGRASDVNGAVVDARRRLRWARQEYWDSDRGL
jgi:hypothetical protein